MKAFRYDPYLWVHLAGLAAVPLWLDGCLLGLAAGYPAAPRLELAGLIGLGVLPALLMQLQRPFCIFCLIILALRPTAIDLDQRKILTLFRRWRVRLASLLVPIPLVWVLLQLYNWAPVAAEVTPFSTWGRAGGLAVAAICFLLANIFLQVPVSVLQVLLMSERQFEAAEPYPTDRIRKDFTLVGLPVNRILPDLVSKRSSSVAVPDLVGSETQEPVATAVSATESAETTLNEDQQNHQPDDQLVAAPLDSVAVVEQAHTVEDGEAALASSHDSMEVAAADEPAMSEVTDIAQVNAGLESNSTDGEEALPTENTLAPESDSAAGEATDDQASAS